MDRAAAACPACGAEHTREAKFCGTCGAALSAACPRCGHANPADGSFCIECGAALGTAALAPSYASPTGYTPTALAEKIRAGSADLAGERKLITVVFADVAGFTSISERLDPEETRAMMQRGFALMLQEVHRFEGTVSQLLGDGMLALFGAPIAHEDHAQRAIRAGLGLQRALQGYQRELADRGIDFRVRVGVHSGPVVFGHVGTDLEFTFQAVGDTVNTASRVQGLARPGSVVVSESTQRLAEGYFTFDDLGDHEVKGKAEPLRVFEVQRPSASRSRVDVAVERGLGPYVGRARELETLVEHFEAARAGDGRLVFISGEAGLGKSRLVHELRRRLTSPDARWLTGRCISYGADMSYVPVIDLVKDAGGIDESDPEDVVAAKLEDWVETIGGDPENLPYLRSLLSIDPGDPAVASGDPQLRKARLFEGFRDTLAATLGRGTTVITIEDLHWIDPLSMELLSFVAELVPEHRLLMLLTHRPGWTPPLGERPFHSRLELGSLSEAETAEVAADTAGLGELPDAARSLIYRKAEGNPFFVEEVTKSLVELGALRPSASGFELARPIEEVDVPDTVQDVIMARLDRLPEEPRRALQTASVIGREFTARLLERTADGSAEEASANLAELKSVQLVYERSLYPELVFMFKHALTHEVAYGSLLRERRRQLHGVVGDAIEELYADRLPELWEALAYHFERAERWDAAERYLMLAAEKSSAAFAPRQAADYCDRVLAVLQRPGAEPDPARLAEIHALRGQCYELVAVWEPAIDSYRAMAEFAEAAGDRSTQGAGLSALALALAYDHRFDESLEAAEAARRIADELDDDGARAGSLVALVVVLSVQGRIAEVHAKLQELERASRRTEDLVVRGLGLDIVGEVTHWAGEESAGLARMDEGHALAVEHELVPVLLWTYWDRGLALCGMGRYADAIESLHQHLELCERVGDTGFWWCRSMNVLGWAYMDLCNWDLALQYNQRSVDRALEFGDPEIIRNGQLNVADCLLATGEPERALRLLEEVEAACDADTDPGAEWMKWRYIQHLWASLGDAWVTNGDPARAAGYADRCIERAEATAAKRNVTKGRRARAAAMLAMGYAAGALEHLDLALTAAREVGNPAQLWKTLEVQAHALDALGRDEEAHRGYAEAVATLEAVAAGLDEPKLRDTLLRSRELRGLRGARPSSGR